MTITYSFEILTKRLSCLVSLLILQSCGIDVLRNRINHTPEQVTKNYIKAIQDNNTQFQQELKCLKGTTFSDNYLSQLKEIKKWTIIEQRKINDESDPDSSYMKFFIKIEYRGSSNFLITKTWIFSVWESNELFEHQKRFADEFNRVIESSTQTINDAKKMFGESTKPSQKPDDWIPKRSEITAQPYCITTAQPI